MDLKFLESVIIDYLVWVENYTVYVVWIHNNCLVVILIFCYILLLHLCKKTILGYYWNYWQLEQPSLLPSQVLTA